ncbi:hypothetical protein GCM10010174_21280 [Kutzneria viridogrisea]
MTLRTMERTGLPTVTGIWITPTRECPGRSASPSPLELMVREGNHPPDPSGACLPVSP